jgi:hypothetical protein
MLERGFVGRVEGEVFLARLLEALVDGEDLLSGGCRKIISE